MAFPLWPFRKVVIPTTLSPSRAIDELQSTLMRDHWRMGWWMKRPGDTTLRFWRSRWVARHAAAIAHVTAVPAPRGADVIVSIRPRTFELVFMSLWITGALVGALVAVGFALARGEPAGMCGLAFPIFGATIFTMTFAPAARLIERTCREALPSGPRPSRPGGPFR